MREEVQKSRYKTIVFWVILAVLVVLSFFILQPFLIPLVSAFVLAYLARPVYARLKKSSNTHIAAIFTIILLLAIIIIPVVLITSSLVSQAQNAFFDNSLKETIDAKIQALAIFEKLHIDVAKTKSQVLSILIDTIGKTLKAIPSVLLSLLVTILATYYMLLRWDSIVTNLRNFIPFTNKDKFMHQIANATKHIVYGYLFIAFIEFVVASIGFYIAGINSYLILAALVAMLAFIPGLGPGIVWVPLFLIQIVSGNYTSAIVVLVTGLVISLGVDFFLRLKILDRSTSIHPLILLIGILGGVPLFGIFGFVIGPLVLVYTIKILEQTLGKN
jgi:predicted PurR-regulated permease PerM